MSVRMDKMPSNGQNASKYGQNASKWTKFYKNLSMCIIAAVLQKQVQRQ